MKFNVTDPTSGQTLTLEGDSPPSEDELNQIFAEHANRSAPPVLRDWQTGAVAQPVTGIPSDENVAAANRFSQQQLALAQLGADTTVAPEMPAERIRSGAAKGIVDWAAQQAGALKELSDVGEARPSFRRHEAALKRAGADFATEEQALSDLAQQQEQRRQAIKAPWVAIEKPLAEESAALKTVTGNVQGNEAATKFAESVSGMLPYVAEAAIPGVGPAAAVASGGLAGYKATLDQAADAYEQAGMSKTEARQRAHKDATRAGLVSAELFAALPGAGKSMAEKMIANRIANAPPVVQAAVNTLSASAQGGVVMGTQSLIDGAMAKWSYNPDLTWEQAIEEAAKSALSGAAATGVIHGTMEAARFAGQPKPPPDAGPQAAQEPPAQSTWRPTPPEFPPAGPPGGPPSGPSGGAPVLPVRERTPNAAIPINEQEGNVPRVAPRQDVPPNSDEIRQAQSGQAGGGDRAQPEAQGQAPPNEPVLTPQPNDFTRYNELTQQIKTATAEQRQAVWQEIEAIKNRNGGLPPAAPEVITAAAYQDAAGNIHTAENHPAILDRLGIKGFETRESRNTPQFGFQTNLRPFISREEASKIEGYPAWHKLHSDEVPSPVEPSKPLADVPQKPVELMTVDEHRKASGITKPSDLKRAIGMALVNARSAKLPLNAEAVDFSGLKLQSGYVKEGDQYVFKGPSEVGPRALPRPGSSELINKPMAARAAAVEYHVNQDIIDNARHPNGKKAKPAELDALRARQDQVVKNYETAIAQSHAPPPTGKPRMTLGKKKPVTETDDLNTGQSGQPQQAVPTVEQIPGVVKARNRLEELIKKGEGNSVYANKLRVRIAELQKPKRIRVSLGLTGIKRFHAETALVGDDILDFINSSGKMMSDSEAKSSWSKEKYAQNKSQWDDKVRLLPHHNSAVYGGKRTPNEVAQEAFEAGKISEPKEPALWQAMGEASAKRQRVFETERKQEEWLKEKGKELQDWQEATKKKGGDIEVTNEQLAVGDMLEVEGERVEVTARDEDGTLTLKDGKKFGIQKLEDGGHLYVEKFEPAPEGEADFGPVEPRREDLALAPAESVEEQKARLAKEQADAQKKADRARLEREAAEGLKGTTGDLGQGDLLGGVSPELAKPADLFAPPAPVQKPPQVEKSAFPSLLEYAKSKLPAATAAKITSESQVESYRAQWEKEKAAAEKPEPPKETRTPAQILRQAERVKVRVPEGATMVRITDNQGRVATATVAALNKANTFRGVDVRKIEAGIIGRDKKFVVVPGEVTVEEPPRNLSLPSSKLSEEQAANVAELSGRTFTTERLSSTRQIRDAINSPTSTLSADHKAVLTKMLDAGLLDQLPGLRIEVADYIEGGATGEYLPNSRIARFLRWSDADVPVHEFFHDLYHFLSPEDQQFITDLRRYTVDREVPQMGEDFRNGLSSDEFLKRGINRDLYHLTNDSEFFTWMMTERAMAHFDKPEARTFGAKMRGIIRKLWTAFKDALGLTPGEDRIWREIIGGKYEYTTGDAMEQADREASLFNKLEVTPENEDDANVVQVASRKYQVMDRGSFSAMQNAKSDARTQDLFGKTLKLPGAIDTSKGRARGAMDSNLIYAVKADGFNYDSEGQKLLTELTQQIEGQHLPGGDAAYVTSLINTVTKNIVAGNFEGVFSQPLIEQLFQVVASERSVRGRMLRAVTGMSEDLHTISRNANIYLKKLYASALGGDAISNVFKLVMIQFRDFFAADDFKEMQDALNSTDAGKKLGQFLDRLQEAMRSESGGRLYKILQGKYKPKQPLAPGQLEAKSFTNEEVAAVLEQMAKLGLTPKERPGKKKLTPMEELRLMVKETSIGRVEADVEKAIKDAERNAGLAAMIKAESIETDPDKKQALRDHIDLMNSDPRVEADEDYVEAGLNDPKFAHWRTIRDNWLGYSPTSLDMVQRVIKGDFKGTRFADGKERPADTRIDLNALAKQPQDEVQRVLDAYYDNVRRTVNMDGVSDATKQRVERMIREQVTAQLEAARKRVRDPMFTLPKDPKAALTADQALAQKLNAGLFKDPRLDLTGMVELAASKSQIKRLVPKMNDLIKEIFATPVYRQEDLQKHFEDMLIKRFDVSPEDAAVAGRMFGAAFDTKFRQAKKRAAASAKQSLSPDERRIFAKRSLWEKIERATNSGLFDTGEVLRQIAKERGWNPPDDGTVRALRSASIREQQLRELTPKEIADLEAKGATPEQIEEARSRKEAATTYERAQLIKRMGDMWSFMTRPMPLTKNPGRMMKLWVEHRRNYAAALNELNTFNLLAKTGFTLYRLPMHLTTQLFGHLPTRAIARAMEIRKDDLAAGRHTQFLKDVGNALNDSAKSTLAAIRPALVAARAEMIGRGESRNVDRLLSGIHALDRLFNKANEYWAKGEYAKAIIGHFFAWPRVMAWYVSAIDHWQGTPVEYADIIHRVEMSMREQGRSRTEIDLFKNHVFDLMKNAITEGTAEAKRVFEAEGIEASDAKLREAGWRVVRRDIYNEIKRVGLPGDDFEAENKILADTQSWQVPTKGGPGMIAAAPLQLVSRGLEWAGLPFSFGRFTNAIATSINYSLMWTPLYKLADVNWPKGEHSTWFGTEFDRSQRIAQAALGTAMGTTALALMAAGVLKITPPWILNKDERDEFERQGHKLNTAEFSVGDGKFIPVSMLVGPMTLIAPYMYFGGSLFRLMDKRKAAQAKLEKEAAARGVAAGKIRAISALDMLDIAAQTAWGAILGNRTVTGVREAASEYGTLNAQKQVANVLSVNVPGLPGWQEISRAMGVGLDKNLASIWDYMVPLPTSKARAVNMLGDPVGTPNDVQRVIQTMTSGTYPWVVDPKDRKETAYEVLYRTGYKPPTINPNKGYLINGEIRPMNDDELVKFTTLRGQYLKQALEANPEASAKDAKAAFQDANARALSDVGASSLSPARGGAETAGGPPTVKAERASTTGSAGRVSAPRAASVAAPAAGGGIAAPRAPSLGGSRTRRMSLGRARAPKLVHGRIRIKRGSSLRGRDRIGVRKPRQRRRMSLA